MRTIQNPGKFEGETALTLFAYDLELNGFADESHGEYSLFEFTKIVASDVGDSVREFGFDADLVPAQSELDEIVGIILWHTSHGFACGYTYDDSDDTARAWADILENEPCESY